MIALYIIMILLWGVGGMMLYFRLLDKRFDYNREKVSLKFAIREYPKDFEMAITAVLAFIAGVLLMIFIHNHYDPYKR